MIDGTLFPFAFAPMASAEDCFTRKVDYTIEGLVICDDAARITWIEIILRYSFLEQLNSLM